MRPDKYIPIEEEVTLTKKLGDELLAAGFNASNSVIVTVSPYPDEIWNKKYFDEMYEMFKLHAPSFQSKSLIFVEAGVIRGGNYSYIIDWVRKRLEYNKKLITVTLYENQHSVFKSDFVGEYYDDKMEDLTFWWERENKHWK